MVFPSRTFDPTATLNALSVERCTHVAIFPPMIQALAAVLALHSKTRPNLEFVTLIGQTISRDDIQKCKDVLRCKKATQAYGLSEGAPVCSWSQDDPLLIQGYHEGVGKVLPGARVRFAIQERGIRSGGASPVNSMLVVLRSCPDTSGGAMPVHSTEMRR